MGNLHTDKLEDVIQSEKFQILKRDLQEGILLCKRDCDYFDLCEACMPASKYGEYGTFKTTETIQCRTSIKLVTDVMLDTLGEQLKDEQELQIAMRNKF